MKIPFNEEFQKAIGMNIEDAADYFKTLGYDRTRVVVKNGEPVIITMEYRMNRINVAIDGDKVTELIDIG